MSNFLSTCAVLNMAIFCSSMISCFPALLSRYCLNNSKMVRCPVIPGITFASTFHMRWISIARCYYYYYYAIIIRSNFFPHGATAPSGAQAASWSRLHDDITHSVGLLWTSDQPDAQTSTWHHAILTRDRYPCPWQESNPLSLQASGRRPKA